MSPRTSRLLLVFSAFVAGLVLFSAVIFIVTGRAPAPIVSAVGDRRPVQADRPKCQTDHRPGHQGPSVPGVLRLHPLSGCVPDHAVRGFRDLPRARCRMRRQGCAGVVHHRRSGARHAGGAQGLSVEFRPAPDRRDRRSGRGRGGREVIPGLCQEGSARWRQLHHGSHRAGLPDGQEGPVRRAIQHQAAPRGGRRRSASDICSAGSALRSFLSHVSAGQPRGAGKPMLGLFPAIRMAQQLEQRAPRRKRQQQPIRPASAAAPRR